MDADEGSTTNTGGKSSEEPTTEGAKASPRGATVASITHSRQSRKRTKTGCLTCRRRRIKCGEERPICNNCVKSKRNCEGYTQQVTSKETENVTTAIDVQTPQSAIAEVPPSDDLVALAHVQQEPSFAILSAPQMQLAPKLTRDVVDNWPGLLSGRQGSTAMQGNILHMPQQVPEYISPVRSRTLEQQFLSPSLDQLKTPQTYARRGSETSSSHTNRLLAWKRLNGKGDRLAYDRGQEAERRKRSDRETGTLSDSDINMSDEDEYRDDEYAMANTGNFGGMESHASPTLGVMIALQARQRHDSGEPEDSFKWTNVLSGYHPSSRSNPLHDSGMARVFCHFVSITAPAMSLHDRHPSDPFLFFQGDYIPATKRPLWTYVLPTMALGSPALLHAILSIACMQMARLQGASMLPSLKHYHIAIRCVSRAVSSPVKRARLDTLAATLLLGYWEAMNAEHQKWNSHLLGVRQLLQETDFVEMTRRALLEKKRIRSQTSYLDPSGAKSRLDESLLSLIVGRPVSYPSDPNVEGSFPSPPIFSPPNPEIVEDFEVRRDLFFYFLRQDVFQSILSSNHTLLNFQKWTDCPPRGPIGSLDEVYGTSDHLLLLFGRLATYVAKDLKRKRRALESQVAGKGPQAPSGLSPGSQSQGPPMYGMMPPQPLGGMPEAFGNPQYASPVSSNGDFEHETAFAEAELEWNSIRQVTQVFIEKLGPDFQPLTTESEKPLATPFGPALYYKSYGIAVFWQMYYTALIILHRTHPAMPPIALMAAGAAARQTGQYANNIGRIAAGLMPPRTISQISPRLAPALMESSLALFFAAVQYQDPAQRGWTVDNLRIVGERTGFQNAAAIAAGCEKSWERAAAAGKGPPYTRTVNWLGRPDERIDRTGPSPAEGFARGQETTVEADAGTRVHWALGVVGAEGDLEKLSLRDR